MLWNCYETAMRMLWNCSKTALELHWNCSEIAMKLLWNCYEIWKCPKTALKLLWNLMISCELWMSCYTCQQDFENNYLFIKLLFIFNCKREKVLEWWLGVIGCRIIWWSRPGCPGTNCTMRKLCSRWKTRWNRFPPLRHFLPSYYLALGFFFTIEFHVLFISLFF